MPYLVIAYPELTKEDFNKIQRFREQNDELYFDVVNPHFTFVFPTFDQTEKEFIDEVKLQAIGFKKIKFNIRCALINKDSFNEYYNVFLVPDKGFSRIVKLHDKLYSNKLKDNLRLDIDYIPHIGIGNNLDKFLCKKMVDFWNQNDFVISGFINELTLIKYEEKVISVIEKIILK